MVGNPPNANLMAELSVKWGKKCIGCSPTFSSCHSNPWFIPPVLKTDSRRLFWTVCSAATDERVSTVTLKTADRLSLICQRLAICHILPALAIAIVPYLPADIPKTILPYTL